MTGVFTDERQCEAYGVGYKSERRCNVKVLTESVRIVYVSYTLSTLTERYTFADSGYRQVERWCHTRSILAIKESDRLCCSPPAAHNHCIRTCFYVPGVQELVASIEVVTCIKYNTSRQAFCYTAPYTQRLCWPYIPQPSDMTVLVAVERDIHLHTPTVTLGLKYTSERKVHVQPGDISVRYAVYTTLDTTERLLWAQNLQKAVVYTPETKVGIKQYPSDRKCSVKSTATYTCRYCFVKVSDITERYITLKYTTISERFTHYYTHQALELVTPKVVQARLEWSSRICFTSMFDYHSERFGFAEKRPLKKVSYPTQSPDILLPFYIQDKSAQMKFKVQRNSEVLTEGGKPLSVESSVFHQAFTIKGEESKKEIVVSGVDNTGAAISLYKDVKKEFLYSTSLQVIIHDHIERYTERTCYFTYVVSTLVIFAKIVK